MNWLRKLFGFKTNFQIMLEHMERTDERYSSLVRLQMGTIDRVVAARFDRPTLSEMPPAPTYPPHPEDMSDVLTDGDDDAFIARTDKL